MPHNNWAFHAWKLSLKLRAILYTSLYKLSVRFFILYVGQNLRRDLNSIRNIQGHLFKNLRSLPVEWDCQILRSFPTHSSLHWSSSCFCSALGIFHVTVRISCIIGMCLLYRSLSLVRWKILTTKLLEQVSFKIQAHVNIDDCYYFNIMILSCQKQINFSVP